MRRTTPIAGRRAEGDARLDGPAFHRNAEPIAQALAPWLARGAGVVLEIGAGAGQHAADLASRHPHLEWRPSDPMATHRASIDAWAAASGAANITPALDLDAAAEAWEIGPLTSQGLRAILCFNVVHITPWRVAEGLFAGAGRHLAPAGFLALYGPFRWHGRHCADSNAAFDQRLRDQDPEWGVRDVDDLDRLAGAAELTRRETTALPSNNHVLLYARAAA